jgi:hypothetical protein
MRLKADGHLKLCPLYLRESRSGERVFFCNAAIPSPRAQWNWAPTLGQSPKGDTVNCSMQKNELHPPKRPVEKSGICLVEVTYLYGRSPVFVLENVSLVSYS